MTLIITIIRTTRIHHKIIDILSLTKWERLITQSNFFMNIFNFIKFINVAVFDEGLRHAIDFILFYFFV
jgi:hypothetical protein